jgi:membrane AbrB-like protein
VSEYGRTALTILLTFTFGYAGFLLFNKLRVPAAAILGSMAVNIIPTALGANWAAYPSALNVAVQAIIGTMIGCMLNREKLLQIKKLALPAVLVGVWMLIMGVGTGLLMWKLTDLDVGSALFAAVPAGISEMTSLSLECGMCVSVVAMFHTVRVVFAYLTIPFLAQILMKRRASLAEAAAPPPEEAGGKKLPLSLTLGIGLAGGVLFKLAHIPGGAIVGAMLCVGVFRVTVPGSTAVPRGAVNVALVFLGASAGLSFTAAMLAQLGRLLWIALLFGLLMFLIGLFAAFMIHKVYNIDMVTCILGCATAGAAQMSTIAVDLGADAVSVSVFHCLRLFIVMTFVPLLILHLT